MAKRGRKKKQEVDVSEDLKVILESDNVEDVAEFVSTGCTFLDYSIANQKNGGVPVGRITELIGENQAGKTLIGTHILAETQKKGGIAICIDTENDMDKAFSYRVGLNWEKLIYKEYLNSLEDVFAYIEKVITVTRLKHKDKLITILWDSIAATPAAAEAESGYDPTKFMGLHARIMSAGLRKIRSMIKSERIALVCTNQLRTKIGVSFGDPTTTAHGKAMSFYASVRIKFVRTGQLKDSNNRIVGANSEAKIIKNKVGPAWRVVGFPIMYDYGVDNVKSIKDYLFSLGIVKGSAWKNIELPSQIEPIKFQDKDWYSLYRENDELRAYAESVIDENMIIKFEKRLEDLNIDIDSILEVEQIKTDKDGEK